MCAPFSIFKSTNLIVGNGLDRSVFKDNPSVTFGDSFLYTREPALREDFFY